jgi:hypothetical protein
MSPLIFQLVEDIDVAERTQNTSHQSGLANRSLHRIEAGAHGAFGTDHPGDGAGHFSKNVIRTRHGLLARGDRAGNLLGCIESGIDHRHGEHENAMLYTLWQHRHLGE